MLEIGSQPRHAAGGPVGHNSETMRYQSSADSAGGSRGERSERLKAMNALGRIALAAGVLAMGLVGPVGAQENIDQGKTPAQLFTSDCAPCHKSPQGLAAKIGSGLTEFLREHYTASKESAATIAAYLRAAGSAPAPGPKNAKRKPEKKEQKSGDKTDEKSADKKTEAKETKPADEPKSDAKTETKPAEPKADSAQAEGGKTGIPKGARPKKPADGDKPN
jgi:hypothetical protein